MLWGIHSIAQVFWWAWAGDAREGSCLLLAMPGRRDMLQVHSAFASSSAASGFEWKVGKPLFPSNAVEDFLC